MEKQISKTDRTPQSKPDQASQLRGEAAHWVTERQSQYRQELAKQSNRSYSDSERSSSESDSEEDFHVNETPIRIESNDTQRQSTIMDYASPHFKKTGELNVSDWKVLKNRITKLKIDLSSYHAFSTDPVKEIPYSPVLHKALLTRELRGIPIMTTLTDDLNNQINDFINITRNYNINNFGDDSSTIGVLYKDTCEISLGDLTINITLDSALDLVNSNIEYLESNENLDPNEIANRQTIRQSWEKNEKEKWQDVSWDNNTSKDDTPKTNWDASIESDRLELTNWVKDPIDFAERFKGIKGKKIGEILSLIPDKALGSIQHPSVSHPNLLVEDGYSFNWYDLEKVGWTVRFREAEMSRDYWIVRVYRNQDVLGSDNIFHNQHFTYSTSPYHNRLTAGVTHIPIEVPSRQEIQAVRDRINAQNDFMKA